MTGEMNLRRQGAGEMMPSDSMTEYVIVGEWTDDANRGHTEEQRRALEDEYDVYHPAGSLIVFSLTGHNKHDIEEQAQELGVVIKALVSICGDC